MKGVLRMKQSLTVKKAEHFGINRKIIANMTAQSWHDIPHVVVTNEPEASEFLKVFKELNEGRAKQDKITLNAVILKVITEALKKCPAMNAHIDFKPRLVRGCVTEFDEINISMPMLLDSGEMMTVNLHNMQDKNLREIRDTLADVQRRAKNSNMSQVMYDVSLNDTLQGLAKGKLIQTVSRLIGSKTGKYRVKTLSGKQKKEYYGIPERDRLTKYDIEQGTITVSNLGSLYKDWDGICALLEIIPPQVAAIGVGAPRDTAIANPDGTVTVGKKLVFTVVFDHRALDMGDVVPFLKSIDETFKNPEVIKEWI